MSDDELLKGLQKEDPKAFAEFERRYKEKIHYLVKRNLHSEEIANEIYQDVLIAVWKKSCTGDKVENLDGYVSEICKNKIRDIINKRKKESFKLTERSLKNLQSEGVSDDVIDRLEDIRNQEIRDKEMFLEILKSTIGDEQTVLYESVILKHARKTKKKNEISLDEIEPRNETQDPLETIIKEEEKKLVFKIITNLNPVEREIMRLFFVEGLTTAEVGERLGMSIDATRQRKKRILDKMRDKLKNLDD